MSVRFFAVVLTGLALVAPGAHLYELLNKIQLSEEHYFIVQSIYRGWWLAGLPLPAAFVANLLLAFRVRSNRPALALASAAAALIAVNLAIFFIWTQPANAITGNWTVRPENWQTLRQQWEYSHAANAGVILLAFCCATLAALRRSE
jgi:exosortase/archaeosortase